jgi:hypothetical protein
VMLLRLTFAPDFWVIEGLSGGHRRCLLCSLQISQTADEFGSVDRTATYRYPAMTKTMIPKPVSPMSP